MPVYEYACRACDTRFEARRPMAEASSPIECPEGHPDTVRVLSAFASVGHAVSTPAFSAAPAGGGGCCGGGGCACAS